MPCMLVLASHEKIRTLLTYELLIAFDQISTSSQQSAANKVRAALSLYKEIVILEDTSLVPVLRRLFIQAKLADMQLQTITA